MTVPRGRRSRESRKSSLERDKGSGRITMGQRKFLRRLLVVLADIVDEKGHFDDSDDSEAVRVEKIGPNGEGSKKIKETGTQGTSSRLPRDSLHKENEKDKSGSRPQNVARLQKICENHGQLTFQIRSSLNTLGGGGRSARALELMQNELTKLAKSFTWDMNATWTSDCVEALSASHKAIEEVENSFKELGIFNTSFFDHLQKIKAWLLITATKLDVEYGHLYVSPVAGHLDAVVWEPLASDLESFVRELADIADKEIATIRLTQEFSTQRYLNLTTVATFLSSVTATTLQITADNSGSALAPVTNTLWFISLVFSTASAVYSLLVMTWRQSAVRQADKSLPIWADIWLRNGPMFALITALIVFSVGLCLLAFQVAIQQGRLVSAAVPTAFAGFHAYAVFLISVWFLIERWKLRHEEYSLEVKDVLLSPAVLAVQERVGRIGEHGSRARGRLIELYTSMTAKRVKTSAPVSVGEKQSPDLERGALAEPLLIPENSERSLSGEINEVYFPPEAAEPWSTVAPLDKIIASPKSDSESENSAVESEEMAEYNPFEKILIFSPDGELLASGFSDSVTVYDVNGDFAVLNTYRVPHGGSVQQVAWSTKRDLLVRSSKAVSVWKIVASQDPDEHLAGHLDLTVRSVRWVDLEDAGVSGFACAVNKSIKVFDRNCKELRSYDLSRMCVLNHTSDMVFFGRKYLLCLVDIPEETNGMAEGSRTQLIVVNTEKDSIQSKHDVSFGHTSLAISPEARMVLLHGSRGGVQVAELRISDRPSLTIAEVSELWDRTQIDEELRAPGGMVTFHGKEDKMIIGASGCEVVVLYRKPNDDWFSALHIFTTPIAKAVAQRPVSFAARPGPGSVPYMFAFCDEDGSVKVWSVQSNEELPVSDLVKKFEVHDRPGPRWKDPIISTATVYQPPSYFKWIASMFFCIGEGVLKAIAQTVC